MTIKSIYAALLTSFILCTGCSDDNNKSSKDQKSLTVATSADYPPFEFFKDGQIVGFEIDLINAIAAKMGKSVTIKDMSFDAILGALQAKRVDAAIASITPSEERRKAVDFSDVYLSTGKSLISLETSAIRSVADLNSAVVGVQAGSTHETFAKNQLTKMVSSIEVKSLAKIPDLIQDLKAKRVSCLLMGTSEAKTMAAHHSGLRLIELADQTSDTAIALPKGSSLVPEINQAIRELIKDGTIEKLKEKWQVQ
jgi:polar amino acid transport system substrate-binding protein